MRSFRRSSTAAGRCLTSPLVRLALGEQRHERLERIVAVAPPVEDQVFGRLDLRGRDLVQRVDLGRVQDGAGQAALAGVVEEHRVEHVARRRVQAEADVRQAEDDLDLGELGRDPLDPVEGLEAEAAVVLVAGADGEGQRVDQQVVAGQAVRLGERDQAARDLDLALRPSWPCRARRWSARSRRRRTSWRAPGAPPAAPRRPRS